MEDAEDGTEMVSLLDSNEAEQTQEEADALGVQQRGRGRQAQLQDSEFLDDEPDAEEAVSLEGQAQLVMAILKPVAITMLLVVLAVRTIHTTQASSVGVSILYSEQAGDSSGWKFVGSLVNALLFVGIITLTTVLFVVLYKYRCMKVLYGWLMASTGIMLGFFGGALAYLVFVARNWALDWISLSFFLWNFTVVGVCAVFWQAPAIVNRAYLICVSGLMAVFFTFLPEWTTWAILAAIALYDVFAVLCPMGPLRLLVETSQQRQEPIPALLYNGSLTSLMASSSEDETARVPDADEQSAQEAEQEEAEAGGVKLGLGDFVFYSVLVGRAALYDVITIFTCFTAIVTGLFGTLILLAIFRQALPALPFSVALGMLFFFLSRFFLIPFVLYLGASSIMV